jgi:hypothetical protein
VSLHRSPRLTAFSDLFSSCLHTRHRHRLLPHPLHPHPRLVRQHCTGECSLLLSYFLSAFVHKIHTTLLIHLDFTQSGPKCSVPNDATFPTYVSAEQHVRSFVCCVDSNEHLPTCCSSHVRITRIGQCITILLTFFRPLVYAQQAGYVSGTGGFGVGV